jgi:hypothetical protein
VSAVNEHPWLLLAPWYRWPVPGDPRHGRGTAPVLQKYASAGFATEFLAEPQRSLRWIAEDHVHRVEPKVPRPKYSLSGLDRVPTERRKLFRDVHCRFYLVVAELRCDRPGLPAVKRDQVFDAGFVVRRRVAPAVGRARAVLAEALAGVQGLENRLAIARGFRPPRRRRPGAKAVVVSALAERCDEEVERLEAELAASRASLHALAAEHGVRLEVQGWIPSEHPGVGAWAAVEETPAKLGAEQAIPLYPLIPDPAEERHSARGRSLWFGVVPTGPGDLDALGNPRFDDRSLYEVRCYVRRKKTAMPGRPPCPGEAVWSRATEPYQLAPAADLDGTSHKPVTFTLPDLRELEAQAAAGPAGQGAGVRMVAPPESTLDFQTDPDNPGKPLDAGVGGLPQICSFSIPLITIIATFVLKLFLPIVVFAFGLWFLLKLKFCILPSFEMSAGLAAELSVQPPELDVSASLSLDVDAALTVNLGPDGIAGLQADLDSNQRAGLARDLGADFRAQAPPYVAAEFPPADPDYPPPEVPLPEATAGLEYYERVEAPA